MTDPTGEAFDVDVRAPHLRDLAEQYADLLAALDRGEALRRAVALLAEGSQVAWAAHPDADGTLTLDQVTGDRSGLLRALRVPAGTGLTGKVFQAGRAGWVDDYFASPDITHDFDRHMATENVRRVLAVPLLRDGEPLGVLALGPRDDGSFGDREIERASAIAAQAALAVSVAERARLSREIAVHEERRRMAADLHDSVGALLFAIGSGVADLAEATKANPQLQARLDRLQTQAEEATTALRDSLRTLRSSPAALALGVALRADCTAFADRTGLPAELVILDEDPPELAPSRSDVLLTAVREALHNVEKHARASAVTVSVQRRDPWLTVAVHDDGVGLPPDHSPGLGLTSTGEALARLGGSVRVVPDPDGGTIWRARLPC